VAKKIVLPGDVIQSKLSEYLISVSDLARGTGLNLSSIRLIFAGKGRITVAVAFKLAKYFKMTVEYWLNVQTIYDLSQAKNDKELQDSLKSITPVKKPSKAQIAAAAAKEESGKKRGRKPKAEAVKAGPGRRGAKAGKTAAVRASDKPKRGRKPKSAAAVKDAPGSVKTPKMARGTVKVARKPRGASKRAVSEEIKEEPKREPKVVLIKKRNNAQPPQAEDVLIQDQPIQEQTLWDDNLNNEPEPPKTGGWCS
jgi:addiction module HigA family antidote